MDESNVVFGVLLFIFGAIIGSFLNVVIYRIPRDKSVVKPGSSCPSCNTPIRFYDNIPFVSYLILRGKCRKCGQPISIRYVAVEMITAVAFAGFFWKYSLSLSLLVAAIFCCLLIVISFIDLDFMIIPDIFSLGGVILGVILSFFRTDLPWADSLLGVLVGGGVLFIIAKLYELIRKREGMGLGDVKLLGMIGAFCGVEGVFFSLVAGSLVGTAVGVPLMLINRKDAGYALPFGPLLSLGALAYSLAGKKIIYGFFSLFPTG
jgi:leader peptidase (prepilin peptidase) / N-methyltransferase